MAHLRKVFHILSSVFAFVLFVSFIPGVNLDDPAQVAKVKWLTFEEAYALNQKEPRKFFVDLYTNWCGWCKKMDANTLSNPIIAAYLNEKYYPIKFNAETTDTISFRDTTYSYVTVGLRGYNQLAYDLADGKLSYPTIVFLNERADVIQSIPGYRDAEELDKILKYFGGNHFRGTDYQTFLNDYQSPFTNKYLQVSDGN